MKKNIFSFVFCILTVPLFVGCGDDLIWDFVPRNVVVIVNDVNHQNLLDPAFENNILDDDISVTYNGEVYPLENLENQTRAIREVWYGFRVGKYYGYTGDDGTLALLLGEFSPSSDNQGYRGETITIDWGDGTSDEIKFDLYVTYKKRGKEATVHRSIWLNGELQSDDSLVVTIVK